MSCWKKSRKERLKDLIAQVVAILVIFTAIAAVVAFYLGLWFMDPKGMSIIHATVAIGALVVWSFHRRWPSQWS